MPISYDIEEGEGLVVTTADGAVGDEELMRHAEALAADERTRAFDELVLVRTKEILVSPKAIWRMADFLRSGPHREASRLAIVVPTTAVYGMARIFASVRERGELAIRVFREECEARAWLQEARVGSSPDGAAGESD